MCWTALDHVRIAVHDVDAAAGPVARLLGRRPSWRGEEAASGVENVLFRLANTVVELRAPVGSGPAADALRARLASEGEGLAGLALTTADAEACAEALAARGLAPEAPAPGVGRDLQSGAFRRWRQVAIPLPETRGVPVVGIEPLTPAALLPEAPPLFPEEEPGTVFAVDHVVVRAGRAEAARAVYGERLGLRLALDRSFPDWGVRLLFFRVGDVTVELAASLEPADDATARGGADTAPSPPASQGRDALWGLSYRVRDADAAHARLAALGFDVSPVRAGRKPGTRVLTVRDAPCGVATLLLEPRGREAGGR